MRRALEAAYDHFNRRLFQRALPPLLLNLSRAPGTMPTNGFFAANAWSDEGAPLCELSITPLGTRREAEEVYSTLVHEMAHFLEHLSGERPKSPGYHGKVWWASMLRLGLPPDPHGNSRIRVSHTIAPDGAFAKAFRELPKELLLPFVSNEEEPVEGKVKKPSLQGKRARYECMGCDTTMRGPSGRTLICGDCDEPYTETGF